MSYCMSYRMSYVLMLSCCHQVLPEKCTPHYTTELVSFRTLSQYDVTKIILKSPLQSCDFDPIPTWLLKLCLAELLPIIIIIINLSIDSSTMLYTF